MLILVSISMYSAKGQNLGDIIEDCSSVQYPLIYLPSGMLSICDILNELSSVQ